MPASIIERTANGEFTEPGIVKVGADNATSETPSISATIAEQYPDVPDTEAATDAQVATQPSATPDAATSSATDVPAIAAPAVNPAATAAIAALEARIAPLLAGLAELKASLLQPAITMPGSDAPTRLPDTDPERDA
ncbi:hypothetical protein AAVH_22547 [Aphelenchoides avenae]|nr:hypothetical protein AAVH_22547 [Aphelenchus avenae]